MEPKLEKKFIEFENLRILGDIEIRGTTTTINTINEVIVKTTIDEINSDAKTLLNKLFEENKHLKERLENLEYEVDYLKNRKICYEDNN